MPSLLAASERAAAQAWLGYVPAALSNQAPAERQGGAAGADGSEDVDGRQQGAVSVGAGVANASTAEASNRDLYGAVVAHLSGMLLDRSGAESGGSPAGAPAAGTASEEVQPAEGDAGSLAGQPSRRQRAASLLAGSDSSLIRSACCIA